MTSPGTDDLLLDTVPVRHAVQVGYGKGVGGNLSRDERKAPDETMGAQPSIDAPAHALAAFVRERLESLELTAGELASQTGISRAAVYRLLSGRPMESVEPGQLLRMSKTLDVELDALVELWDGRVVAVQVKEGSSDDPRRDLAYGFVTANNDLSVEQLRAALNVARAAADAMRAVQGDADGDRT